ncbi:MAG TPA: alpha/beta fold hydrolase [Terracidiphilus sp.]|jgi:homoserine O-acetyltransferase
MRIKPLRFALALLLSVAPLAPAQKGDLKFAELGACKLTNSRQIEHCRLGYRTWGTFNAQRTNAILFPTWFSGNSSNIGDFIGAAKMLDPTKYFIIAIDAFGDGVSSSPSNSTIQHGPAFPAFTTRDMVNAEYRLATETFRLTHVHAVIGVSMGGMQTFEWMVNYPDFMDIAIPIVGSTRLTSYDQLLWHAEEDAMAEDPAWHNGNYTRPPPLGEVDALHQMNLSTPAYYARTNPAPRFDAIHADYFSKGILPFDANDWRAQLEAMIHHDVAHGGSLQDAAKKVKARVLVIVAAQDHMVNPKPALDFAPLINAKTLVLESDCGHLAFGCESEKFYPAVRYFLDGK